MTNQKAYFFDMDGVLFDSMPHHAVAWEEVMKAHNLSFTARDCYINEGRTGESIIREAMLKERHREATPDEINLIYGEKSVARWLLRVWQMCCAMCNRRDTRFGW